MYCKNCGKTIPEDSVYCPQCGAPVGKVGPEKPAQEPSKEASDTVLSKLQTGRIFGMVSLACSILGLGSFGTLDIVAIICGYLGLKQLKEVPDDHPDKHFAVTLNRAGILCSAAFIILILAGVLIALLAAPWIFALIGQFFAGIFAAL